MLAVRELAVSGWYEGWRKRAAVPAESVPLTNHNTFFFQDWAPEACSEAGRMDGKTSVGVRVLT